MNTHGIPLVYELDARSSRSDRPNWTRGGSRGAAAVARQGKGDQSTTDTSGLVHNSPGSRNPCPLVRLTAFRGVVLKVERTFH